MIMLILIVPLFDLILGEAAQCPSNADISCWSTVYRPVTSSQAMPSVLKEWTMGEQEPVIISTLLAIPM